MLQGGVSHANNYLMHKLIEWIKAERGRLQRLADSQGITHAAIKQWDKVPADRVVAIAEFTGIPRQQLRPDLYDGMMENAG